MTKYKTGDRVKLITSGRTGEIVNIYDMSYWNIADDQFSVKLDDGAGLVTVGPEGLEKANREPEMEFNNRCSCGVWAVGGKHSPYCNLYDENA